MLRLRDIANHAGVSPTTVSVVLNDRHETLQISEKTRLKVLQAAEELGYRTNHMARAMRTGNSKMLGILGGKASEEQVGQMLEGALEAADAQGYTLKILRLDDFSYTAQHVIRRSSELRLMGMIALHLDEQILEELHVESQKNGTPLVLLDARCKTPDILQVLSDDHAGVAAGVEHLVKIGHSKIAFIGGDEHPDSLRRLSTTSTRKAAFQAAMERHQLHVPPEYIANGAFRFRDPSFQAACALLSLPVEQRPTAIFCSGDLIALATLQAAGALGLSVPRDLSVIGFANMMVAEFANPQLTTIDQPFANMGRTAVNVLLGIINERSQEETKGGNGDSVIPTHSQLYGVRASHIIKKLSERSADSSDHSMATVPHSTSNSASNMIKLPTQFIERHSTAPPPSVSP